MPHRAQLPLIPTVYLDDPAHREVYGQLQATIARAKKITIVCGAGISTAAGIPDYRSEDGLYHCQPPELGTAVNAKDLFNIRNLSTVETFLPVSRMLARMRIMARNALETQGHRYIHRLSERKRLVRCYTSNIDGILNREGPNLMELVLELHGRNELKCNRCGQPPDEDPRAVDDQVLKDGIAFCTRQDCLERASLRGSKVRWNLRRLPPGVLLPDVVWNEDSRDHGDETRSFQQHQKRDGNADLLIVIGTSLATDGVARLVRSLAQTVRSYQGAVVYVGRAGNMSARWSKYFDLHIEGDIDAWAADACKLLAKTVPIVISQAAQAGLRNWV
ncbi:NAD-dependent histone deacetylase SIR2 [Ceratobasidium sp. AG-Ba]|nr:NAD-dependent histone deacetylase SIR2 [Ceratobasidium sp. AG-Ba]